MRGLGDALSDGGVEERRGHIRIRSNVCTEQSAWQLVPGELVTGKIAERWKATEKQKRENMGASGFEVAVDLV